MDKPKKVVCDHEGLWEPKKDRLVTRKFAAFECSGCGEVELRSSTSTVRIFSRRDR